MGKVVIVAATCMLFLNIAYSGEWRLERSVSARILYTDNPRGNTSVSSSQEQNDWALSLRPGLRLSGKGGRLDLNLAYFPSIDLHTDTGSRNGISHFLDLRSTTELYRDHFFLDMNANARLVNVLRDRPFEDFSLANNDNTQTYTYRIVPRYIHRLGSYMIFESSAEYRETRFTDSSSSDVKVTSLNLGLSETRWLRRIDLGLNAAYRSTERVDRDDFYISSVTLDAVYPVSVYWRLTASVGYEKGNFIVREGQKPEGNRWRIGADWTPSSRVLVGVSVGERFFGSDYSLNVRYRHRHSNVTASYQSSYQTAGDVIGLDDVLSLGGSSGSSPGDSLGSDPFRENSSTPSLTSEIFLRNRFSLSWSFSGRRHQFDARVFYVQREYSESLRDEEDWGISCNLTHRLSGYTSVFGRARWDTLARQDSGGSGTFDFTRYSLELGVDHDLGSNTTARLSIYKGAGDYSDDRQDYDEHRLNASFSHRF